MPDFLRGGLRLAALLAFQLVAALVLIELAARALDPLGISYYAETARYLDTLVIEEPIGYRNRPGLDTRFYGVPVRINSLGMRDRELGPKAPGEFRVAVLGDSVPFGIGVVVEDSLPRRLERILAERHPGRSFRTLNFGVTSYNTEQELMQLESLGLSLAPDAVLLIFATNDIEPKRWVLDRRSLWYVDWAQRSYAVSLLFVLAREARAKLALLGDPSDPAQVARIRAPAVHLEEYRLDSPRWQAIDRSLAQMNRLLRERGVPFVLFAMDERPPAADLLEGVAAREGFPFVNLRRDQDPRWKGQEEAKFHNSRVDQHPSALGNQALATLIAESLERLEALGRR